MHSQRFRYLFCIGVEKQGREELVGPAIYQPTD